MIRAAHIAHLRRNSPFDDGLGAGAPLVDRARLLEQQQGLVEALREAKYARILRDNPAITLIQGTAQFVAANALAVTTPEGEVRRIEFDRAFIGVGARPAIPPIPGLADTPYLTSTSALSLPVIPKHLLVIGGSAVALELAQAFARLGSEVTILVRSRLLSRDDPAVGDAIRKAFEREGIRVLLRTQTSRVDYSDGEFILDTNAGELRAEQLLIATGRTPNTEQLNLEQIGVKTVRGAIQVDERMQTNVPDIYAAGDCNRPTAVRLCGRRRRQPGRGQHDRWRGHARSQCHACGDFYRSAGGDCWPDGRAGDHAGLQVDTRVLSLDSVPRALVNFDTHGFIKMVAEQDSGRLLGVQAVAAEAGELIQTAVMAMRANMTVQELAEELFPYLTTVEGLKLCAQTFTTDVTQLSCCAG